MRNMAVMKNMKVMKDTEDMKVMKDTADTNIIQGMDNRKNMVQRLLRMNGRKMN
jgi:hypothetical protein